MKKHLFLLFVLSSLSCRSAAESGETYRRELESQAFLEVFTDQAAFFSEHTPSLDQSPSTPASQSRSSSDDPVSPSIEPIAPSIEPIAPSSGAYLMDQDSNSNSSEDLQSSEKSVDSELSSGFYSESERVIIDPSEMAMITDEGFMEKIKMIINGVRADCRLRRGTYLLRSPPQTILGMTYVTFAKKIDGCPYATGFVFNRDVRVVKALQSSQRPSLAPIIVGKKTACEFSWEEKPGTTDYTTWDSYLKRTFPNADRPQGETLQGAKILQSGNSISVMCTNAKILKNCFEKANNLASLDRLSSGFLEWSRSRGVNPVRLRMAIAMKETHLGGLSDSCSGSTCNGVGLNQVITIVTDSGAATNSSSRPEWPGITHNILTNMKYGMRVLALKVREAQPQSIWELAKYYNGSSTSASYATAVVKNYEALSAQCGL